MIIRPYDDVSIDCYVDSDFAGLWGHKHEQSQMSVKSRTGYLLHICNYPILWKSQLQTEIELRTMEAEYVYLRTSMKELIPLIDIVAEVYPPLTVKENGEIRINRTVWEDNNGEFSLGNFEAPRMTPRSKHYSIKYHWFRSKLKSYRIVLKKIASEKHLADILNKPLGKIKFKVLR